MRITLPERIKRLPFAERQQALQDISNEALHSKGICPLGEYVAGPRSWRVRVWRPSRHWEVTALFEDETYLEQIAVKAISCT